MPKHRFPFRRGFHPGDTDFSNASVDQGVLLTDRRRPGYRSSRTLTRQTTMVAFAMALLLTLPAIGVSAYQVPSADMGGSGALTPQEDLALRLMNDVFSGVNPAACPDLVWPQAVITTPNGVYHGSDGMNAFVSELRVSFPDARFGMDEMVVLGDTIVVQWKMSGTHDGVYLGHAPSGTPVVLHGVAVMRVLTGKVVEEWVSFDQQDIVAQIESGRGSFGGACTLCESPD